LIQFCSKIIREPRGGNARKVMGLSVSPEDTMERRCISLLS
jgi:hypothetical protein